MTLEQRVDDINRGHSKKEGWPLCKDGEIKLPIYNCCDSNQVGITIFNENSVTSFNNNGAILAVLGQP